MSDRPGGFNLAAYARRTAAKRWRMMLAGVDGRDYDVDSDSWSAPGIRPPVHPSLADLADLIEATEGAIPREAIPYVAGRLRGTIKVPRGRQARPPELVILRKLHSRSAAEFLRARYVRRRDAYSKIQSKDRPARLKFTSRRRLAAPAWEIAIAALANSTRGAIVMCRWETGANGPEGLRKLLHSAEAESD